MSCNIVFDYISPHNGEYWYHCTTCGARDWFGRTTVVSATEPLGNCRKDDPEHLTNYELEQQTQSDIDSMTRAQLLKQVMHYRKRIAQLEKFEAAIIQAVSTHNNA